MLDNKENREWLNKLISNNKYSFIYDDVDDSCADANVDVNDFVINLSATFFVEIHF